MPARAMRNVSAKKGIEHGGDCGGPRRREPDSRRAFPVNHRATGVASARPQALGLVRIATESNAAKSMRAGDRRRNSGARNPKRASGGSAMMTLVCTWVSGRPIEEHARKM